MSGTPNARLAPLGWLDYALWALVGGFIGIGLAAVARHL